MALVVNAQTDSITVEDLIENLNRISGDISEVVGVLKTKRLTGTINIPPPRRRTRRHNVRKRAETKVSPPVSNASSVDEKAEKPKVKQSKKQYKQKVKPLFSE